MGAESTEFLRRIVEEFHSVRGIILSDSEGLHICSSFSAADRKEQNEKFIQTTTLLISAINQTEANLHKTKTYSNLQVVNFYYEEHLIHLAHVQHLIVTIFLTPNTSIHLAKEISTEVAIAYEKLNSKIPDIRQHCG